MPSYIALYNSGELNERITAIKSIYGKCNLCPHKCSIDRVNYTDGYCRSSINPIVASATPHFGEEPPLVGKYGSGTIFFTNCNLRCIYCQNCSISQMSEEQEITCKKLAEIMINLQNCGCHNINFVTPTHMVYPILGALEIAIDMGLQIPLVYNSGGYDSLKTLKLLDGIFDIYMPDFKYHDEKTGFSLSNARYYPEIAKMAIKEMYRQVGDLKIDQNGIAYRGLIVRHLILPGFQGESKKIIEFIASLSTNTYINIMDQYRPEYRAVENSNLTRRINANEYFEVIQYAKKLGLTING